MRWRWTEQAGKQIGKEAMALALASEGASVAIAARRVQRLDAVAGRLRECGTMALPIEADVADESQSAAIAQCSGKYGTCKVMVRCSGRRCPAVNPHRAKQ